MRIPPHIAWPLVIIAFLLAGVASTMTVLYFSRSDGGVQIVPEYYENGSDSDRSPGADSTDHTAR